MTEPEVLEAYSSLIGTSLTAIGLYFTAVSGYLATAFLAGNKLTPSQYYIISSLFVVFTLVVSFVGFAIGERGVQLENSYDGVRDVLDYSTYFILAAEILGIFASLRFMAGVRSNSEEQ